MNKPTPETITFYVYDEVIDYINEKYGLNKYVFTKMIIEEFTPDDGEMIYLNVSDYIQYGRYNSQTEYEWYKAIEKEFGSTIVLEWSL